MQLFLCLPKIELEAGGARKLASPASTLLEHGAGVERNPSKEVHTIGFYLK